jgi:hypothetical protein
MLGGTARASAGFSVPWSRPFDDPIQLPEGKAIVTLKDAAAYILKLPKAKQRSPEWQAAGEAVIMAAEDRGPLMHAHVGMMLALHGAKPILNSTRRKKNDGDAASWRAIDRSFGSPASHCCLLNTM